MASRLALLVCLLLVLAAAPLRKWLESPAPRRPCSPEGRGIPPRHWLGCAADDGPPRVLEDEERLALGLPLDLNAAGVRGLSCVPGLSRSLAAAVIRDREANGRFPDVRSLLRVRGIGPKRLSQARSHLVVAP